ncbi:MAG: RagB/SusD family nutrient uptake outer membrane protein [Odoribacteraceae bacterium]|nr:RagB/SusD family nutrient uptake outer membrane protein [Odoribacteraceae bacterium]
MKKIIYLLVAPMLAACACACSDWLEVLPKSRVLANNHFETEQGFADQLTGVYTRMSGSALYGRELTFGLREVLSQNYDLDVAGGYARTALYEYADEGVKARITAAWAESYTAIANLNLMLEYLEDISPAKFSGRNYDVYKGEALGLRAFLHFELLRMFAPAPAAAANAQAIPYVTKYTTSVTPLSTVNGALDLVIADLTAAAECLKSDTIFLAVDAVAAYGVRAERAQRFNYYAARATLARAYLWRGDVERALAQAEEVIEACSDENLRFYWSHFTAIMASNAYERDLLYKQEHIFRLEMNKMVDIVKPFFTASAGTEKLSPSETKMDNIYEVSSAALGMDYRYTYHYAYDGGERYLSKFWQPEGGTYLNMMPLIRLAEVYYIAAEALAPTDPARAVELLNVVREHRGLSNYPLPATLSPAAVQEEILKEYRKETLGEGQLFYYYKRLNLPVIPGSSRPGNNATYVFPLPDNEIEFGNR